MANDLRHWIDFSVPGRWREDDDKLTFIVLARTDGNGRLADEEQDKGSPDVAAKASPEIEDIHSLPMVGDVNLFLKGAPPIVRPSGLDSDDEDEFETEVEVMIAGEHEVYLGCHLPPSITFLITSLSREVVPTPRSRTRGTPAHAILCNRLSCLALLFRLVPL